MADVDTVTFAPPGGGMWELETTHHGLRPISHLLRGAYVRAFEAGTQGLVERYGLPLERVRAELVHGCFYVRPQGLGEGDTPSAMPPKVIMKVVARLHPGMRRRNRAAAEAWRTRRWRQEVDQWFDHDRTPLVERNLRFQSVELAALDDAALADEIRRLLEHFETQARRNLETHGGDLMPVGDLLAHGERWRIPASELAALLEGGSPATVETARLLSPVARELVRQPAAPTSLETVRALGDDVREAVDAWERLHAWRLVTSDDVDRPTLAERPSLRLAALVAAVDHDRVAAARAVPDVAGVRARVPAPERGRFDELLAEARYGMRQREDIRGVCWNWTAGLVRRAMLEAGRRLVARGGATSPEHAAELSPEELHAGLVGGSAPGAEELAERAAARDRIEALPPPRTIGPHEDSPPLDALPAPMARATAALMANLSADVTPPDGPPIGSSGPAGVAGPVVGVGIGTDVYRGRACVVGTDLDELDRLRPGDVMIAAFVGPSCNSIVPILGALVVEEGGPLCHAAIVAREFGLPAVTGARGATTRIPDGALVEVDPRAGEVRVV
jgi:pyruvate,water dikinase